MTSDTELPDIDAVAGELTRLRFPTHPAGAHGVLCGMLSAGGEADFAVWLASLAAEQGERLPVDPDEMARLEEHSPLGQLYWASAEQLEDPEYQFDLLLPDDDRSIAERCEALAAWCSGFLYGLGSAGLADVEQASPEVREVLEDVVEISRFSVEDVQGGEEEEQAFMELEQYLRVAALLVWAEFRRRGPSGEPAPNLH